MAEQTTRTKPPVLDLSQLTEVFTVKASNGQSYPLKTRAMGSALELYKLTEAGKRIDELAALIPNLTREQAEEFSLLANETCRAVWDAPADVHDALNDAERILVIQVFTTLQTPDRPTDGARRAEPETIPSTSEHSPAELVGSTAAEPLGIG